MYNSLKDSKLKYVIVSFLFIISIFVNFNISEAAVWRWVTSTDEKTYEIDASTVRYSSFKYSGTCIVCWQKNTNLDQSYDIYKIALRYANGQKEHTMLSFFYYDSDGNLIKSENRIISPIPADFFPIVPDSVGDALYDAALLYVK